MALNKFVIAHFLLSLLFVGLLIDDIANGRGEWKAALDGFCLALNIRAMINSYFGVA